jgi:pimeloyl-ACP methyl ester carboxylesterase
VLPTVQQTGAPGVEARHRMISIDGLRLHLVEAGPEMAPAVLLLHGFPEYWAGWRQQIPALAAAGFRVLVPDQRGYNQSDKPPNVADYRLDLLAQDAIGLLDRLGIERAHLVGHDWGAAVAWWAALSRPERVNRMCILNVPHPAAMTRVLRSHRVQWLRSWYIGFFQLPLLPEALLGAANGALLAAAVRRSAPRGVFGDQQIAGMRAAWGRPRALRSMINWYRALLRYRPEPPPSWTVNVPTRILWGTADAFLIPANAPASLAFCAEGDWVPLTGVGHWVQHEAAVEVNRQLIEWFSRLD